MTEFLLGMPTLLLGAGMVGLAVLITIGGGHLLRSRIQVETQNEAVTTLYGTVATIYTVLLAFVVVIAAQHFQDAESEVVLEATRLSNVLRDSEVLSESDKAAIYDSVAEYIRLTSTAEWQSMADGRGSEPETNQAYRQIWEAVYAAEPVGVVQESFYQQLLDRLNDLAAARRTRLLSSETHVPALLWLLLLGGGFMTLGLAYFLPQASTKSGIAAMVGVGSVITLTLFLIFVMDHPYTGSYSVAPDPLTDLLPRAERGP